MSRMLNHRSRAAAIGLTAAALVAVMITGCAANSAETPSESTGPPPSAAPVTGLFPELSSLPSGPSAELITAAKKESGKLTTYLSFSPPAMQAIFDAFKKEYPFVTDGETIELSASKVEARIVQESLASGKTGDYGETPANYLLDLLARDLMLPLDAKELGVPAEMMDNEFMVTVSSNLYGLAINTDLVKESERPHTWADLLDPAWSGNKIAMWTNAASLGNLAPVWGETALLDYVAKIVEQKPSMFGGATAVVQAIGAGEVPLGITTYHQVMAAAEKGTPIAWYPLEVVTVSVSQAYVPLNAENPSTGKLFLSWFASKGYDLKEQVTFRGVPNLPGSTKAVVGDNELSGWRTDQSEEKDAIEAKVSELLPRG